MTEVNYKSTRLLVEAVSSEMDGVRRILMAQANAPTMSAMEAMNGLRALVDQLAAKADRPTVDDVKGMPPADYVATMKPLVAEYHRLLLARDLLAPCLCEDVQAIACVVILIGDGKTVVRGAHDQARPEAALAVEAIIASIDDGTKRVVAEGAAQGIVDAEPRQGEHDKHALLQEAEHVGWDTPEGEALRKQANELP
jgi:hypothetical protein